MTQENAIKNLEKALKDISKIKGIFLFCTPNCISVMKKAKSENKDYEDYHGESPNEKNVIKDIRCNCESGDW